MVHSEQNGGAAFDGMDTSFGHEEQQAQDLRRAQSTVLHRKVARKQQRQARHQRKQEAQQQRQRLLRLWKKAEAVLEQRQQKQFQQFRNRQQERTGGMKRRSERPAQKRQQHEPERWQQDEEEDEEDWVVRQAQEGKRTTVEGVAVLAKTRKRKAKQQRQMLCDDAMTGTPATSRSAGWNGEASGTCGENVFNEKRKLRRKAVEMRSGKDAAHSGTSENSKVDETEERSEDGRRRKEFFAYTSCTDDYVLPKKGKTSSKLQDVLTNQKQLAPFSRAQEIRQHRLDDQREIRYLERQLGFNAPGISDDRKKKLVAKELAVLGFDDDFVDCLDVILEPPQNTLQQHQPQQDRRPDEKGDQRDAEEQQQGTGRERRSIKGTEAAAEEDFYRDSNEGSWTKTKSTMTLKPAVAECCANSGLRAENYHVHTDEPYEQKATMAEHTQNIQLRTRIEKKMKKRKISRERPVSGDASSVVTERILPSTAAEEHAEQRARLGERAAATKVSSIRGKKDGKEEDETTRMPEKVTEEGDPCTASQAEEYRNPVDFMPQFSCETDCTRSGHRSSEGDCYVPPHVRRRLRQEKRLKQYQQHADGSAGFVEADDTVKELQLRLRGLLNRASEGNVEVVLQQMVAAIKEAFSQVVSFTGEDKGFVQQKKQQQLRRIHEHFMQRLCEGLSTLFIQNAVENKFSVNALIATQTALCCSLSAILGTQLLRCFLEALGRCFLRHYQTSLLLDTSISSGKSEGNRFHGSNGAHASTGERMGQSRCPVAEVVQKDAGCPAGKPVTQYPDQKELEERNQDAISTAAMYARHVVATMCFLFDYGALPATVYLQLLERLTVTQSARACAQGFQLSDRHRSTKIDNSSFYNSVSSSVSLESKVVTSCPGGNVTGTQAVLSEFQVECLLLALRLGGRKLRYESPQLFKNAWVHLMDQATPALQTEQTSASAGRPAQMTPGGREKRAAEDVGAEGSDESRPESGHLEKQEKEMLERLKLRFQQRAAADRAAELLHQGLAEDTQGTMTTNGRLRFLVHELQELKNNKSNSSQLTSSAAAQETMRRWLQTSSTLRSTLSLGASSNCCAALLEDLEGITWQAIEDGSITMVSTNRLYPTSPSVTDTSAGGKTEQLRGTSDAMESQCRTTTAAAALRELESTDVAVVAATTASSNSRSDNVVTLAAKLRFHTENQKTIFSTLMSASNPNDAVQRLLQMSRNTVSPKQQVVDVVAVVLHSCLQEKTFNPFYAILLARLCGHCCCGSLLASRQSPDEKNVSTNRGPQKAHPTGQRFRGDYATSVPFSASTLPTPGAARHQAAVAKLRAGCTCYTLPQKEAVKYKRVLQRGIAAQTSAAHAFSLRRLLHLAKLEAFLIRLGILELRLIRFLNFDEAAKEPDAGHMGLTGKFGRFLKELCVELLCDQSQASVSISRTSTSCRAAAASADAAPSSPLPLFFSVCNLPDVREALVSVLQEQLAAESSIARERHGGRRLSTAMIERAIWLLKEAEFKVGEPAAGEISD